MVGSGYAGELDLVGASERVRGDLLGEADLDALRPALRIEVTIRGIIAFHADAQQSLLLDCLWHGGRPCAAEDAPAASTKPSASDRETRERLRRMCICSWVSVDDQGGTVGKALEPQWLWVDERPIAGDDVRHELPRRWADAKAMPGETSGDVEARP